MSTPIRILHGDPVTGPLVMLFGIAEWIDSQHEAPIETVSFNRPQFHRSLGRYPFFFNLRIEPPPGTNLAEYGVELARLAKTPPPARPPVRGDRAVYWYGGQWARDAQHAVSRDYDHVVRVFGDVKMRSLAIRAWLARS